MPTQRFAYLARGERDVWRVLMLDGRSQLHEVERWDGSRWVSDDSLVGDMLEGRVVELGETVARERIAPGATPD